ncbi:hypothetical protein J5N97_014702 [Dioscorea zingiberensis]|uniref:non-specific serine/threonine protein kinase n=1 Tax=Dioscorea zingiberensis TaxID=325984 RepID=A0A9D5CTY3_9LILI|nr:hypothetical protein J5N97_014702 [Dioscorea zingiberensis]
MPPAGNLSSPVAAEPPSSKVIFNKYALGRILGRGGSAKVHLAHDLTTGLNVAIKIICKHRITKCNLADNVLREVDSMRRLRHPNVVRLHEVLASRTKIYLVLDFLRGGELFTWVAARGRFPEDTSRRYFRQLVSALGYCHARGVFHRDLKPENLLLDEHGDLKVTDFGLSALQPSNPSVLHTLCGTPAYVAPEILSKKGYAGASVDVWSAGIVLFVLTTGYLPFNDSNLMNLYRKIHRGVFRCPRWTSPELRRLLARLLDTNPETRITFDEILRDPWFRKGLEDDQVAEMARFGSDLEAEITKLENNEDREMNAFDIISFSSGFDLSGLFVPAPDRQRFLSTEPAGAVLDRVVAIAESDHGLRTKRSEHEKGKDGNLVILEGHNGNVLARVGVYRLTGKFVVVEVEAEVERLGELDGKSE